MGLDVEVHSTFIQITNDSKLSDNMNTREYKQVIKRDPEWNNQIMFTILNAILDIYGETSKHEFLIAGKYFLHDYLTKQLVARNKSKIGADL